MVCPSPKDQLGVWTADQVSVAVAAKVSGTPAVPVVGIEVVVNTPADPDRRIAVPGHSVNGSYYWFKRPTN